MDWSQWKGKKKINNGNITYTHKIWASHLDITPTSPYLIILVPVTTKHVLGSQWTNLKQRSSQKTADSPFHMRKGDNPCTPGDTPCIFPLGIYGPSYGSVSCVFCAEPCSSYATEQLLLPQGQTHDIALLQVNWFTLRWEGVLFWVHPHKPNQPMLIRVPAQSTLCHVDWPVMSYSGFHLAMLVGLKSQGRSKQRLIPLLPSLPPSHMQSVRHTDIFKEKFKITKLLSPGRGSTAVMGRKVDSFNGQ